MNQAKHQSLRFHVLHQSLILAFSLSLVSPLCRAQQARRPFTVADDIGVVLLTERSIRWSPDGKYLAVYYERGRIEVNRVEDSLRFYRNQDLQEFLEHPEVQGQPSPVWVLARSSKEGRIIRDWRWLVDSSGVAFLELTDLDNQRLMLATLRGRTVEPLTPETETVKTFDIRDRSHYVYTVADLTELEKRQAEGQKPAIVGTGRDIEELLFPDNPQIIRALLEPGSRLWAVAGAKPFEVGHDNAQFIHVGEGNATLVLSPDGHQIVTALRVPDVPSSWERLYPPASIISQSRVRAGAPVNQYVLIDLYTGSVQALTGAPTGDWWWEDENPSWSNNGRTILLPNTFIKSKDNLPSEPCTALVNLPTNTVICVGESARKTDSHVAEKGAGGLEITVKQGLNEPPVMIATSKAGSRVIWDPNPQLNQVELGQAQVYRWKDKEGRGWSGGIYKPVSYRVGQRYPLVIQTHGFAESQFIPSGYVAHSGYAARELAAIGIIVLQVAEEPGHCGVGWVSPTAGPCAVAGYESAVNQLVSEGLVDPARIGIMGFSATCYSVMQLLTTSALHVRAAALNDGSTLGYLHYITGDPHGLEGGELAIVMGDRPFGEGLQVWLKRSPGFNLDKVTAPLLVNASGPTRLIKWLWEPYRGLRYLHKPVELIILNTNEHLLTNPAVRMASQGGSVDWFRFWLQDYEDPDPAKAEQYKRWRGLRTMQEENTKK